MPSNAAALAEHKLHTDLELATRTSVDAKAHVELSGRMDASQLVCWRIELPVHLCAKQSRRARLVAHTSSRLERIETVETIGLRIATSASGIVCKRLFFEGTGRIQPSHNFSHRHDD